MKALNVSLLLLVSMAAFSQNVTSVDNPIPASLYKKANESLASGDTRNATEIFDQVIAYYKNTGKTKELSESYLGMALAFAFNGNYEESIRYHKKALRAHHRYRSKESDDAIKLNLGLAYRLAGKDRKANRILN